MQCQYQMMECFWLTSCDAVRQFSHQPYGELHKTKPVSTLCIECVSTGELYLRNLASSTVPPHQIVTYSN